MTFLFPKSFLPEKNSLLKIMVSVVNATFSFVFVVLLRIVITKGYGARATTIEGQNAFALLKRCALLKFHVI